MAVKTDFTGWQRQTQITKINPQKKHRLRTMSKKITDGQTSFTVPTSPLILMRITIHRFCNYLRPSNNSRQLIFNINAVALALIIY